MDITRRRMLSTSALGTVALAAAAQTAASKARAEGPTASGPLNVQMVIFDGVEIIDALGAFDTLTIAGNAGTKFKITLFSLNGAPEITALGGVVIKPTAAFDPNADILMVPGGPQLWRQNIQPAGMDTLLQQWVATGKLLACVCTGAVFAARAGVLKGRNVVSGDASYHIIEENGATVIPRVSVVDDGNVVSSGGPISGFDLSIHLIERFYGAPAAIAVERIIEYTRRGTVWRAAAT